MGRVWKQGACWAQAPLLLATRVRRLPATRICFAVCLQHGCTPACCPCRDLENQRLTVRVLDADVGKADDLLGTTMRGLKVLVCCNLCLVWCSAQRTCSQGGMVQATPVGQVATCWCRALLNYRAEREALMGHPLQDLADGEARDLELPLR